MKTMNSVEKMSEKTKALVRLMQNAGVPKSVWFNTTSMKDAGLQYLIEDLPRVETSRQHLFYIQNNSLAKQTLACAALSKVLSLDRLFVRYARWSEVIRHVQQYGEAAYMQPDTEAFQFMRGVRNTGAGSFLIIPNLFSPILGTLPKLLSEDVWDFLMRHLYDGGNLVTAGADNLDSIVEKAEFPGDFLDAVGLNFRILTLHERGETV